LKFTSFKYKTRKGPDYRHGDQVTFIDLKKTFNLGNIRIGKWVTRDEKELAANVIYDSLADLAFILALPPEAIGLRGTLNLAFGTGGRMGVQAHYAPYRRELALAKNAGAGALAHEFWHAFDHYISDKAFEIDTQFNSSRLPLFASDCWLKNKTIKPHPLNERLMAIFDSALLSEDGLDKSDYLIRSVQADLTLSKSYFSQPTEMMARAFESVIEFCAEINNPYLVYDTLRNDTLHLYPDLDHRYRIYNALLAYFKPLGMALTKL